MRADSKLVGCLIESEVLNEQEAEKINSKQTETAKTDQLLCIIQRTSREQFRLFVHSLYAARQDHVADKLRICMPGYFF